MAIVVVDGWWVGVVPMETVLSAGACKRKSMGNEMRMLRSSSSSPTLCHIITFLQRSISNSISNNSLKCIHSSAYPLKAHPDFLLSFIYTKLTYSAHYSCICTTNIILHSHPIPLSLHISTGCFQLENSSAHYISHLV